MSAEPDADTLSLLREQLRDNPRSIIRKYPDKARELAHDARQAGREALAEEIEALIAEIVQEGSS